MSKESFENGLLGVALEDSEPHPTIPNQYRTLVAINSPSTKPVMDVLPTFVEFAGMLNGTRYCVNAKSIRVVREWKNVRPFGKPCLRIDIDGFEAPVHVDMGYDEFVAKLAPTMVVNAS